MTLELNAEEAQILVYVLKQEISEIGPELRHTETSSYHDELKHRKEVLFKVLRRLETAPGATPTT